MGGDFSRRASPAPRRLRCNAGLAHGLLAALLLIAGVCFEESAAQTYQRGQNVAPAFEGWERNEDGSFSFLFGYMNRNWSEQIDVPVGEDNSFSPGDADRGQPTHFQPRRNRFVFKVRVPADWGDNASMRANQPPVITLEGPPVRETSVGRPVTITVLVEDDGLLRSRRRPPPPPPETAEDSARVDSIWNAPPTFSRRQLTPPSRITVQKVNGLFMSWFLYRGADGGGDGRETSAEGVQSALTFDPPQVKVWEDTRTGANSPWSPLWVPPELPEDGRWTVDVTFDRPGTYLLRGRADDGGLFADVEVTVVVRAATS